MGTAQDTSMGSAAQDPRRRASARRGAGAPGTEQVHRITDAPEALSDDIARRSRRYMIQMGIRTACFLLAVVVDGPMRWVLLAGAAILPWVAVLLANAGREADHSPGLTPVPAVALLESAPAEPAPAVRSDAPPTVEGEAGGPDADGTQDEPGGGP